ncbi:MAG TPA: ATP-binding protein [Stellaceae bacterium]|jgi:signal transduction histidine kinase|nr:ATP-binding protein [Stellaceae bacterium]
MHRRVLIVDDDGDFAESLLDLLAPKGYLVQVVGTAERAHASLRSFDAQVALFDIRLGLASGVDLFASLKAERPELIGVIMTAHVDSKTAIEALRRGAYDYIDKSCHPGELYAVLERCFDKIQLRQERTSAYEALRVAKEAAERANRAKSDFLATMSHELRTPLNAIIGFSEIMAAQGLGPVGNEKYLGYIKDINDSGVHLLAIINDILDLSKAEAGKLEMREDVAELRHIIDAAMTMVLARAKSSGVTLVSEIPAELPYLWCDERMLKQVLLNILSNGIKFTPSGGRVAVTVGQRDGALVIAISDTGIGIASADIAKAFEPFGQVDNRLSRKYDGTGLGLPLAAAMIAQHGGNLTLTSEVGSGTTVTIVIPAQRLLPAIQAIA